MGMDTVPAYVDWRACTATPLSGLSWQRFVLNCPGIDSPSLCTTTRFKIGCSKLRHSNWWSLALCVLTLRFFSPKKYWCSAKKNKESRLETVADCIASALQHCYQFHIVWNFSSCSLLRSVVDSDHFGNPDPLQIKIWIRIKVMAGAGYGSALICR